MQIPKSEKKIIGPTLSQILGTPLSINNIMSCNDFVKKYELAHLLALFCFDCRYRAVLIQARAIKHSNTADSAFN